MFEPAVEATSSLYKLRYAHHGACRILQDKDQTSSGPRSTCSRARCSGRPARRRTSLLEILHLKPVRILWLLAGHRHGAKGSSERHTSPAPVLSPSYLSLANTYHLQIDWSRSGTHQARLLETRRVVPSSGRPEACAPLTLAYAAQTLASADSHGSPAKETEQNDTNHSARNCIVDHGRSVHR